VRGQMGSMEAGEGCPMARPKAAAAALVGNRAPAAIGGK
jgi:hypothetical protein